MFDRLSRGEGSGDRLTIMAGSLEGVDLQSDVAMTDSSHHLGAPQIVQVQHAL